MCALHRELIRWGLVTWTSGNVSGRVPGADRIVIKPSGIAYDDLTPESMVVTDLHGRPVDGDLVPSSDTLSHAYIYREMPDVNGIVHTHSTVRDGVGGPSRGDPVRAHRDGRRVRRRDPGGSVRPDRRRGDRPRRRVDARAATDRRSVLLGSHGVFAIGDNASAAVKAAVMCEDVARTVHHARTLGDPVVTRSGRHRQPVRAVPERLRAEVMRSARLSTHDDSPDLVPHRESGHVRRRHAAAGRRSVGRDRAAAQRGRCRFR